MGYEPVYDYAKDQLGVQAGFAGAQLVEGNWYCPSMPQTLKDATKDLIAEKIDKQTWIDRIRARAAYLFMPKQRPDVEGHRRVMCPAEANRTQCSLKEHTLGRGIHLPLIDPAPSPAGSPRCCSQKTVTVPPESGANLWQPLQYGSEAWQRVYFRLRNSVEGINGYAKDRLYERLEDAGTRRIRGIAAQTLLLAFQLAHANRRKLRTWADSIALHGDRPHRRPTRRRKTKPGHLDPQGLRHQTLRASSQASSSPQSNDQAPGIATEDPHTQKPDRRRLQPSAVHVFLATHRGTGGIVITMPPVPSVQLEHLRRCSSVREGGVEPPRPCGHWNLNPARLPIPPPAHWVCPPAPSPCGAAPSDIQKISTLGRVGSHRFSPSPSPRMETRHRPRATYQRGPVHVSTSYRSRPSAQEPDEVHSQVRDTGLRPPLRSWAEVRTRERRGKGSRRLRHPSTGSTGGTSRFTGAWIRSVSSTR